MAKVALVLALGPAVVASTSLLRATKHEGTVNDKIKINGDIVMEGSGITTGCHIAPKGATEISVCGPGYKVVANLLTECQDYKAYSQTVGFCDAGNAGCDTRALESGYTEKFKWEAASYEVLPC